MSIQTADALMGIFGFKRVEQTCSNCQHGLPSQAYPMVACMYMGRLTPSTETCVKWGAK